MAASPLTGLAVAVEARLAAAGIDAPVYIDPLDAVEAPCVMLMASTLEPSSLAAGSVSYGARINAIGLRADVAGAIALADAMTFAVVAACVLVTNAGWSGADDPRVFPIGGVDYVGRESQVRVVITTTGGT